MTDPCPQFARPHLWYFNPRAHARRDHVRLHERPHAEVSIHAPM